MAIYYNGKIVHSGIKGMKWGRRRWQNADGSLTPAGRKRYLKEDAKRREAERIATTNKASDTKLAKDLLDETKAEIDRIETENKYKQLTYKPGKLDTAKGITEASSKAVDASKKLVNLIPDKKAPRMDLSSMSDQELRSKIDREMLERRYNDVFGPNKTSKGKERLTTTLEVAGGVLAVGASALAIAVEIKKLKGN